MRALAIALLSGLLLAACGSGDPEPPRNLLLLSIDTLRADALGSHGSERGASPFLDRWAERGVRFASAWSQSPKTAPSHMTLLTGLAPRVHGVGNFETAGSASLGPRATTLAEVLSAEGFATGGFTDGGNARGSLGFNRGFEHFVSSKPKTWESRTQQVRTWLTELDGRQPWFLFLHTYAIHDPYFPPPEVAARFVDPGYEGAIIGDRAALEAAMEVEDLVPGMEGRMRLLGNYWGRVEMESAADMRYLHDLNLAGLADLDRKLERLFGWMEERGLLDDTLVVITSDHGEEFGEHGKLRHDQLWRELTHVPLL
ncbi:MAG: sulfatase, partial [Planctomycetota bacterium]